MSKPPCVACALLSESAVAGESLVWGVKIVPMSFARRREEFKSGLLFSHEAAFLADRFGASERVRNRPIIGIPVTGGQADYRRYSQRWYPAEDRDKLRRHYPNMLKVVQ